MLLRTAFHNFYEKHPFFPYVSYWITGFILRLYPLYGIGIALFLFSLLKKTTKDFFIFLILLIIPFYLIEQNIPNKNTIIEGQGIFQTFHIEKNDGYYLAKGKFLSFKKTNSRKKYKNIQCIVVSQKKPLPKKYYILSGKLKHITNEGIYIFQSESDWNEVIYNSRFSCRKVIQKKIFDYINKKYPNRSVASFLSGICLGKKPSVDIRENFKKLGLAHLLVISGFHFSLITNIFMMMTFAIGKRKQAAFLIIISTLFMLIQNPEPSLIRSWISCLLFFSGVFFEGNCSGINRLSFSLIAITICSPSSFITLSLQFSFLATAGIIFFFQPIKNFLVSAFQEFLGTPSSKIKRILLRSISCLSQAVALNISAHLFLWPLLLKYFSTLPLGSFFYNLFFPFAIYISVIGLLIGAATGFNIIHTLNGYWCNLLLEIADRPPLKFKEIYVQNEISNIGISMYLIALMIIGILLNQNRTKHQDGILFYSV